MIIKQSEKKLFEQPDAGLFLGTIIDVIDLGLVKTNFNGQEREDQKIQVVWVLDKNDKEGRPFQVRSAPLNANINMNPKSGKKSRLYELIEQVFQQPPTLEFESESFLGRSNQLFLVRETDPKDATKVYTNIKGLLPLSPGQVGPKVPQGFVRAKDKKQGFVQSAPVQSASAASAAAPAQLASNDVKF